MSKVLQFEDVADHQEGALFPGTPVLFAPEDKECTLIVYVEPVSSDELSRIQQICRGRRGRTDTTKLDELFTRRALKGWTGFTAEMAKACHLYPLSDAGVVRFREKVHDIRKEKGLDDGDELPFSVEQAIATMGASLAFNGRITELATDLEELQRAREASEGKV